MGMRALTIAISMLLMVAARVQGAMIEDAIFENAPYADAAKAISKGDIALLGSIIGAGIDLNFEGHETNTPWGKDTATLLIWAVWSNKPQMVELLLKAGADPNKATRKGMTPLIVAVPQKTNDIFELLLQRYKANPNKVALQHTALTIALDKATEGQIRWERVEALLKHGADINIDLDRGMTPVIDFTVQGDYNVVLWLLEHGANYEARDSARITMMCYLRNNYKAYPRLEGKYNDDRNAVRDWLLAHGVKPSRIDPALHLQFGCDD
jgi:uncharacterized protein